MSNIKKILIVGSNFINKGAQSMLFICVDEFTKRFNNCDIYFACNGEVYDENNYRFKKVLYTKVTQSIALCDHNPVIKSTKLFIKDCIKWVLFRRNNLWQFLHLRKLMPQIDLIVDISGYALGNISSVSEHEYYLNSIRLAKKYNIPIVLMPQSFGPFNYIDNAFLLEEINSLISYPTIIFTREEEGKRELENQFHINNIVISSDLVLQNKSIDLSNIYVNKPALELKNTFPGNSVAIIPNYHCFVDSIKERTLSVYRNIINCLLNKGKNIYVFRHSSGDLQVCKDIKAMFGNNSKVVLIEREFSCIEYDDYISNFEFVICSRYHGCVHAYRNGVPSIILGWAIKYIELAKLLGQEQYIFDVLADEIDFELINKSTENMCVNYAVERRKIIEKLQIIQSHNCFDIVEKAI